MERATVSRIESWEALSVPGGYAGLSELAEDGFTGAVSADGAWLFMLNGRVVGVSGGTMSSFEGGDATAYEAPDPALPLLFAMQERGGEVRGQYYTDDTPIREVDETLSEGGFTGYLELSENVLSGDYYVAYYGGRSLAAAFIGNEGRVVTGDEAFELAADEVGIYEVRAVDVEVNEIPEPSDDEVAAATGAAAAAPEPSPEPDPVEETDDEPVDADDAAEPDPEDADAGDAVEPAASSDGTAAAEDPPPIEDAEPAGRPADGGETAATDTSTAAGDPATAGAGTAAQSNPTGGDAGPQAGKPAGPASGEAGAERGDPDERFREEERWRETRTVPALDPDESAPPGGEREPASQVSVDREEQPTERVEVARSELESIQERVRELESELESTERDRRQQAERVEKLIEERDELLEERTSLEERIEELESRIETQEERIEGQEREIAAGAATTAGGDGGADAGTNAVDPATALDQTDLFVRYGSKGKATLQTAHDGGAEKGDVSENLRIETHSRFDPQGTAVSGRPFEDYLADTIEYRFVSWLIEDLLYEIRDTGSVKALRALYDALPRIDRAEFNGTVTSVDEEGEEHRETFHVVCRDRMGKPLVVANINDSLDPATGEMMGGLVEDATAAAEAHESLGAAFFVTASFFEPDALETASEATGGGFLSRESKKSFVKLSRKGGYHLSLVEARGGEFHVAVPEF